MNDTTIDCAIVGGGLAGLTLAVQLADAGCSVIVFEKEKYPFHKVCGEYVSMESYAFLERIGVRLSTLNLPMINTLKISAPNGNSMTQPLELGGFGISRYLLDTTLADLAQKKGVVLLQETKVTDVSFENELFTIKTSKNNYRARVACGTYGKYSLLDKKLNRKSTNTVLNNRKNYVAVKYHVKAELPDNQIELHNFKGGYCGISKVDGDKHCMCYLTSSRNLKDNHNDIKQMEKNVLMKNPFLKKHFSEATFLYEQPLTISQITFAKKTAIESHLLMLGDSAGTIAPLCGNGMSMAMQASFKAFSLIEDYLNHRISRQRMEFLYSKEWNTLFLNRIKAGNFIQYLSGKETLTNIVIRVLKKTPIITRKLIRLTHGNRF